MIPKCESAVSGVNNESYTEDDDRGFSDNDVPIKQFTAPDFDDFDFESDDEYPDSNIEFNDSWILLDRKSVV